jgi:hypothetical protein
VNLSFPARRHGRKQREASVRPGPWPQVLLESCNLGGTGTAPTRRGDDNDSTLPGWLVGLPRPGRGVGDPASRAHSPATHSAARTQGRGVAHVFVAWHRGSGERRARGGFRRTHDGTSLPDSWKGRGSQAQARFAAIRCFDQVASLHPSETLLQCDCI